MQRMGRNASGIGFALYLDLLEGLGADLTEFDVDVLLVYSDASDTDTVLLKKKELIESGKTVLSSKAVPEKIRYREIIYMD